MCKHLLNAQVSIRYYNGNWYDCPLCFFEEIGEYPEMHRMGSEYVHLVSFFHPCRSLCLFCTRCV